MPKRMRVNGMPHAVLVVHGPLQSLELFGVINRFWHFSPRPGVPVRAVDGPASLQFKMQSCAATLTGRAGRLTGPCQLAG